MTHARKLERSRSILGATIVYNNRNSTIECQIRNISRSGAKLSISHSVGLPEEFDVEVPQKGKTYRARLCWRDEFSAGIEFILEANHEDAEQNNRVAELEAENTILRLRLIDLREKLAELEATLGTRGVEKAA